MSILNGLVQPQAVNCGEVEETAYQLTLLLFAVMTARNAYQERG